MNEPPHFPHATYRLQLNAEMTFQKVLSLIDYFHELGISHLYLSPILKAKIGSTHGYDITDPSSLNPEIGTEEDFKKLVGALKAKKMGLLCDIVPNHMYIVDPEQNVWWRDVLENGPSSPFAKTFDIDWNYPRKKLVSKVLLPFLEEQYGDALEKQNLSVIFQNGSFHLTLPYATLPTDPCSWNLILEPLEKMAEVKLSQDDHTLLELKSIMTAIGHLPKTTDLAKERVDERRREKEVIKERLQKNISRSKEMSEFLTNELKILNGEKGVPRTFDALEEFINVQPYRLAYWRVASDEINYRRFFDVIEFAGIRTEDPDVFKMSHSLIFQYVRENLIDGLRIDHIDGLWDPEKYLHSIREECKTKTLYLIVEKILLGNEKLAEEWPVDGTVGYDFLYLVNGLFVEQSNKKALLDGYKQFIGVDINPFDLKYISKKLILLVSMSSELYVLSRYLDRLAEQHRSSRDFTEESLRSALRDVIACFPVYRSYISSEQDIIHEEDEHYIVSAISRAKRMNPAINSSIFDFIQKVLLLDYPSGLSEQDIHLRKEFVMRFQQITSPVMGKGLEDTSFYRYFPLASLNEVGGDLLGFGKSVELFHKKNSEKEKLWPNSLLASSTHDTKRSEDVRARINVLSEIPEEWMEAISQWSYENNPHKIQDGDDLIPSRNDEYLLYQTLIGTWALFPMEPSQHIQYMNRILTYMEKATKEAKIHTSWVNPNETYDNGMKEFIRRILNLNGGESTFLKHLETFVQKIQQTGMLNSLSQLVLKMTSPGIPDIYQGNEIWDFSLVDPDNRREVDFTNRQYLLKNIQETDVSEYPELLLQWLNRPEDGKIKLFLTHKLLEARKKIPKLFTQGTYLPLSLDGKHQNKLITYARIFEGKKVVIVTSRFFYTLIGDNKLKILPNTWQDHTLILPNELKEVNFLNHFTGKIISPTLGKLALDELLNPLPFALLEGV